MELGDFIIALFAAAVVTYGTGRLLIAEYFAARRRHFDRTMHDLTREGEIS